MVTNIFVYWSDGLGDQAFDRHSRYGCRAFANESCPQGRTFDQFFPNAWGLTGAGLHGGMLAVRIYTNPVSGGQGI